MTILVTGGAGFIGSNFILDWLAQHDEPVLNLDKLTYAGNPENLVALAGDSRYILIPGDIGNQILVDELLAQHAPRAIVNFAAESHVDRSISGPSAFIETNIVGTFNLLECARRYVASLEASARDGFRFLHVSTDEVYGSLEPAAPPFREDHQYQPNSPYSASKASADHLVRAYGQTYGLPVLTSNCSNNYGPYQFPEKLIPLMILHALEGKSLPIYGDGGQIRDWLHVTDHCSALRRILDLGVPGQTYNIGGGNEKTNLEVVHAICGLLDDLQPREDGGSYSARIAFVKDRLGHDRRYAVDGGRMKRELEWAPAETFESGMRKTVLWYLAHRKWIERVADGSYRSWLSSQYSS